ncbi:A-kinase-interacting protein 1 [Sphaeramia orbicularis]|uniref:A kinase (PRKA) interacting protein 1 n=1 Tax=Sphaeramia orbicularis TaxID=375764 RepID=A0A673AEF9_9TELE|nr:A-kinase-interacting protein 1 [Sphaeramia orbicularis]XP_029992132.1 A-kinase-interacting protein 1 [Sphaeramia orbicularis]XP_029992133.1 A-kinase-interacting protein 1 [Sphaeramia orbicularis]XP_029992134.1 A-kinase-interacting protein 1 [Sphaeramia orbicularis]XP_029992135.1 A-kinase-interacting protein 1 [Sphaeramia orbicularis]XP_029992136.1 A-kinase-interacting protein 1 [Sphaeramia orbicularis]XP_029992138.1 A-kinase-interacting protein 1 [Sphaeramia orbicularis]
MAGHTWLDSSLRRSARLGLEVLDRASRRSVDWTSAATSRTPTACTDDVPQSPAQRTHSELDDAFSTIAEFMTLTTLRCKMFYESGCSTDSERKHVSRFHRQEASRTSSTRTQAGVSGPDADFYIEVSPGTYAVSASLPEAPRQTRMVSVNAGESVNLTFNL